MLFCLVVPTCAHADQGEKLLAQEVKIPIGQGAHAQNEAAIAIGKQANSLDNGIAIGEESYAGSVHVVSIGAKAQSEEYGVALGYEAQALLKSSVALGHDAQVAVASAEGAVALGAHSKANGNASVAIGNSSVADEEWVVSVGNSENKRRIVNVKDAVHDHDAVNLSQLKQKVDRSEIQVLKELDGKLTRDIDLVKQSVNVEFKDRFAKLDEVDCQHDERIKKLEKREPGLSKREVSSLVEGSLKETTAQWDGRFGGLEKQTGELQTRLNERKVQADEFAKTLNSHQVSMEKLSAEFGSFKGSVDQRFTGVNRRIDDVSGRTNEISRDVENKYAELTKKIEKVQEEAKNQTPSIPVVDQKQLREITEKVEGLEGKVNDNASFIENVGKQVVTLEKKHSGDVAQINGNLNQLDEKLSGNIARVGKALSEKIDGVEIRVEGRIGELVEKHSGDVAQINGNLTQLDEKLSGNIARVDKALTEKVDGVETRVEANTNRIDRIDGHVEELDKRQAGEVARLDGKIDSVESELAKNIDNGKKMISVIDDRLGKVEDAVLQHDVAIKDMVQKEFVAPVFKSFIDLQTKMEEAENRHQCRDDNIQCRISSESIALAKDAVAAGERSVAIGNKAEVSKEAEQGVALGDQSQVNASRGVALGGGANVSEEAGESVALGSQSVANEERTVSVGNDEFERRIVHVAEARDAHDAVNLEQLKAYAGQTDTRIKRLDRDMKRGFARQSALSALMAPMGIGKCNVTAALGGSGSTTALAVGAGYRPNSHVAVRFGVSGNTGGGSAVDYNVGASYEW